MSLVDKENPALRRARVGVVGTGWWASTAHLPALQAYDGATLAAVCDLRASRARAAADHFGAERWFTDIPAMLADAELDAVVVATPHSTHHAVARAALDAGLHVLVEKPLTVLASQAYDLIDAAARSGVEIALGYTAQYAEPAAFVRSSLADGSIGELVQVTAEFSSNAGSLYAAAEAETDATADAVDDPTIAHPATYGARFGGGQALTQLTHLLGMVMWATDRRAEEVFCYTDRRGLGVDVVDAMTFRLAGGGLCTAASTGTADGFPARHLVRYHGTDGMLEQDIGEGTATLHRRGREPLVCKASGPAEAYPLHAPARTLADLATGRGTNVSPGLPAARTVALIDAALRSATSGRPEAVSPGP